MIIHVYIILLLYNYNNNNNQHQHIKWSLYLCRNSFILKTYSVLNKNVTRIVKIFFHALWASAFCELSQSMLSFTLAIKLKFLRWKPILYFSDIESNAKYLKIVFMKSFKIKLYINRLNGLIVIINQYCLDRAF